MKPFPLLLSFAAAFLLPAGADPDANANNLGDIWEKHFNGGEPFSLANPAHLPGADPDGDGYDNLAEYAFGTDPFSAAGPHGAPGIRILRHPEEDHIFLIRWESVKGVKYQLQGSPDLGAGGQGWLPVDDPVLGTGEPIVQIVEVAGFEAIPVFFWRLHASPHDTDGDGINDAAEWLLGSSPYLADTGGSGHSDLARYLAGQAPAGDNTDSDGDGVPDNVWYSVVFEVEQENLAMPAGIGFTALDGDDPERRYLTTEITEEYFVSGSHRYEDVSGGEYKVTVTYLDGNRITADGQTVSDSEGQTFADWKSENEKTLELDEGESFEADPPQTEVETTGPSAAETETVTTTTVEWRVKKDGQTVRGGTETIETIHRIELKDEVTWQDFWSPYVTARPWEESSSAPAEYGPLEWVGYNRAYMGDALAAESVRDRFRGGDFSVFGKISNPGVLPSHNTGNDTRLKSLRWRWVRFDPNAPFDYKYEAPPSSHRQTFRFLVQQRDYLNFPSAPWWEPALVDETRMKGVVELECTGGSDGWHDVPLNLFGDHEIDEPGYHQDYDFDKVGHSQVFFGNLPANLSVDANRDGEITLDGRDRTTQQRPFRFWVNNDQDDVEVDEPAVVQVPDSFERNTIQTMRDLEDFCRLKLSLGFDITRLRSGEIQIGLRFRSAALGNPAIRIWPNQSVADGNADYLTGPLSAGRQMGETVIGIASSQHTALIPPSFWESRIEPTAHLIFEGVGKGLGELAVTLHDQDGQLIGQAGGLWLHLLNVREMYQRARIVSEPGQVPHPWDDDPSMQIWEWDPWDWSYAHDPRAENVTTIFVHGWRLTYATYLNWADTSYKRLWHQGFKGRFYTFRWPTFSGDNNVFPDNTDEWLEENSEAPYVIAPPGGFTYNHSEYRAWLCGPALANFVNQLPNPGRRSLFAHSMGNVTAGSALRAGMSVQFYAMCNAAMSAMAYDPNPELRNVDRIFPFGAAPVTPDTDPDPAIRSGYGLENKFNLVTMPEVFNFGLPDDQALDRWVSNNLYLKPQIVQLDWGLPSYSYSPNPLSSPYYKLACNTGLATVREITALPEAMAYVTKSRTRTAGADLRTRGCIIEENVVSMAAWFNEIHSAQWRWNNQSTHMFWQELFESLELKAN